MGKPNLRDTIILAVICLIFILHSYSLEYTQDDAYISYRYVENFMEGHGLVFNYGERVEGYTNFLWIMILSLISLIGLPMILFSKIIGVAAGVGTLILSYFLGREYADHKRWYLAFITPFLLAINGALAYWVIGGLETGLFIFLTLLVIYAECRNPRLTPYLLVLTTLTRPEGALLFGIVFLYRIFVKERFRSLMIYAAIYIGLLLPYAAFKLYYFGDLLPNPFYAKTGLSIEYLQSGLQYLGLFAFHYGLFGILFLLPVIFWRSLPDEVKLFWLTVALYTFYVVLIGGDVLKVHRFFLPLLPLLYLSLTYVIGRVLREWSKRRWIVPVTALIILFYACWSAAIPWKYIRNTRMLERGLIEKMDTMITDTKAIDTTQFSLATTTIGRVSYLLKGHKVIDMLGLTDPYIAKHPEKIEGLNTTWKERNFNSVYLLGLRPDYILFSTGYKPSAPAERALVLNSQFRQNYSTISFPRRGTLNPIWNRRGDFSRPNQRLPNPEFANLFNEGYNFYLRGEYSAAEKKLLLAHDLGVNDFSLLEALLGTCYLGLGQAEDMLTHYEKALQIDSANIEVRYFLQAYYGSIGDSLNQKKYYHELISLAPWFAAQ